MNSILTFAINHFQLLIQATNVTDDVLKTINYCISYFNSSSVVECSNTNCSSCIDGVVVKLYLMLHDQCQPVNVNISAINALGKGSPLQHIIAGNCVYHAYALYLPNFHCACML